MSKRHGPRGDEWLEALFDQHNLQLRAFALRRVEASVADDVVAEVFAIAWRRRAEVPTPALPWLYQTARNVVLHEQRSMARRLGVRDTLLTQAPPRAAPSAADQARSVVDQVLNRLGETDSEVLRLTVWEQLTPVEIAIVLDITPGAARNRLMRARQRARELYLGAGSRDEHLTNKVGASNE